MQNVAISIQLVKLQLLVDESDWSIVYAVDSDWLVEVRDIVYNTAVVLRVEVFT